MEESLVPGGNGPGTTCLHKPCLVLSWEISTPLICGWRMRSRAEHSPPRTVPSFLLAAPSKQAPESEGSEGSTECGSLSPIFAGA